MYKVRVKTGSGTVLPPVLIKKQLEQVMKLAGGTYNVVVFILRI